MSQFAFIGLSRFLTDYLPEAAVLELLALMGSLTCGVLADRFSRRQSIVAACVIFCIGSAIQCGARTLSDLVLGRAIGGFGVGALR